MNTLLIWLDSTQSDLGITDVTTYVIPTILILEYESCHLMYANVDDDMSTHIANLRSKLRNEWKHWKQEIPQLPDDVTRILQTGWK